MIRIATDTDLPAIVEIYNEAVAERFATADLTPVTLERREQWFEEHDPSAFPIYVFDEDGVVRGWCSLSCYRSGREALLGSAEISYTSPRMRAAAASAPLSCATQFSRRQGSASASFSRSFSRRTAPAPA